MILPKFKEGDLVSASDWNLIASEVNRIWGSEGANGIKLTKGEPWRIRKTGRTTQPTAVCQAGGLNGPAYKVYVWRGDKWDWGSDSEPLAFFVGGDFTQWGTASAVRIAKFIQTVDCELNSIGVDTEWQANNSFGASSGIYHLSTTKGATPYLLVGSLSGTQRNGAGGFNVVWQIDWETGLLRPGFSPVSGASIGPGFYGSLLSLCAIDGHIIGSRFTNVIQVDALSGAVSATGSPVNNHNLAAAYDKYFMSSRCFMGDPAGTDESLWGLEPHSLAYISANYVIDAGFGAGAGVGADSDCLTLALTPKGLWYNQYDEDKICWSVHSLEFGGQSYSWAGAAAYALDTNYSCIVPILKNGTLHPAVGLGSHLVATLGGRASVFSAEQDAVWFGGDMSSVASFGVGPITVTANNTLCRYSPNTNAIDAFEFNGPVYDCKHFYDGQMIVVGNFTQYVGVVGGSPVNQSCNYMAFINQAGEFVPQLTWP
jgi:hypothetical protein